MRRLVAGGAHLMTISASVEKRDALALIPAEPGSGSPAFGAEENPLLDGLEGHELLQEQLLLLLDELPDRALVAQPALARGQVGVLRAQAMDEGMHRRRAAVRDD